MKTKSKKLILGVFVVLMVTLTLSSCSVAMAARKSGTDVSKIQQVQTRTQILATGAEVIESKKNRHGNLVETYKIQKEKGSIARAVMHGVLDISTFFVWEAFGTPIEGSMMKKEYFIVKVTYDAEERVKKIELS